jgi:hypothetical protein
MEVVVQPAKVLKGVMETVGEADAVGAFGAVSGLEMTE